MMKSAIAPTSSSAKRGSAPRPASGSVGGDGDDVAVLGREQLLADDGAVDLELRDRPRA